MLLTPMRFKDYVWPHNPRTYGIEYRRDIVSHKVPFGVSMLQDMGRCHRVLRGEGEFAGAGAYDEFRALATVFYENSPGILIHPVWQTSRAWFVELSLRQEPAEDYAAYSFEFWECTTAYTGEATRVLSERAAPVQTERAEYYTVVYGDRLYTIAAAHGTTTAALIALNPQIKNPNLIYSGDLIRIR